MHCETPDFEEKSREEIEEWGISCSMDVSLDGQTFIPCEGDFIIYEKRLKANNISPRCASIDGQIQVSLTMNIDEKIIPYMNELIVGFC
jgi:hypothetical protein